MAQRDLVQLDEGLDEATGAVDPKAVEEVLLQSYLFLGFPAALDGLTRWRRRQPIPTQETAPETPADWEERGPDILERVYGGQAHRLRANVRALHPALERWMVLEGYGKVLGRAGLTLAQRELAISAQLAVLGPSPQLYSHLRGALRVGAKPEEIEATLAMVSSRTEGPEIWEVWDRVLARSDYGEAALPNGAHDNVQSDSKGV